MLHRQCRPPAHVAGGALPGRDHPLTSHVVSVGTSASAPTDHQLPRATSHLAMIILRCDETRRVHPRRPGGLSYERFRSVRTPPGRLFSYRAVTTFVASGTRRAASTPQASPRTLSLRPHRGGAFNAIATCAFEASSSEPLEGFAALEDVTTEMRTTENCAITLVQRAPSVRAVTATVSRFRAAFRGARSGSRRYERFGDP
jgi:hypothetical protein